MLNLSDTVISMDENTDIGDYDLFIDQNNHTAEFADYNLTLENCNLTLVTSEEGYLWPYVSIPLLITSIVLGQLLRDADLNLEF